MRKITKKQKGTTFEIRNLVNGKEREQEFKGNNEK